MSSYNINLNTEFQDLEDVDDLGVGCPTQSPTEKKKRKPFPRKSKHGDIHTKLYKVWGSMRHRCKSSTNKRAAHYYDKGITVCSEWGDFKVFREWAYNSGYSEGLSIDRINNDLGYSPDNCRWTTRYIQGANTKVLRSTNKSGYRGVSYCVSEGKYKASIRARGVRVNLGTYTEALDAAKAYQTYIILHRLENTYVPVLTEEEIKSIMDSSVAEVHNGV